MSRLLFPLRNHIERYDRKNCHLDDHKKYKQLFDLKPNGYWYGFRDSWYEFWGSKDENLVCEVKIKNDAFTNFEKQENNKILMIKNLDDIKKLNKLYGKIIKDYKEKQLRIIEWKVLSKKYGGIEFRNYKKLKEEIKKSKTLKKRRDYSWYLTVDVESGCVWDLDIIEVEKIGKLKDFVK